LGSQGFKNVRAPPIVITTQDLKLLEVNNIVWFVR